MDATQRRKLVRQNLDVAHDVLQRMLNDPDAFPKRSLVIPMSLLADARVPLTPSRWQVLMQVRSHGQYKRLQDLADDLGRGKHRVSKDVDVLATLGLLRKHKQGREMSVEADSREILVA
jgi:DNA-binding MarR family transcriptional regulator